MRNYFVILIFVFLSCKKKETETGPMTVIKGGEGSYLRLDNLDYTICNEFTLDNFKTGEAVKASIERDDKCVSDRIHSMVVHEHQTADGNYKVIKISKN